MIRRLIIDAEQNKKLDSIVEEVRLNCPGESEYRYLGYLREFTGPDTSFVGDTFRAEATQPLVVSGLPQYADIQCSKILALLLGEALGNCVAYSDYNQSYLTDIRPTALSKESSAGTDLLGMHNDFPFIDDLSRPRILVLLAHVARGTVPMTFLAPSRGVLSRLDADTRAELGKEHYEARVGGKLAWKQERVYRFSLLAGDDVDTLIRFHFDTIKPAAGLSGEDSAAAARAIDALREAALAVGREHGHRILEGEALVIPNDYCLHGRDAMESAGSERLLLRSYVAPDEVVAHHRKTMITLDA